MAYRAFLPGFVATVTVAALLGAASSDSRADARASVRLTNFGYSLVDLNPGDGIAPAVSFNTDWIFTGISAGVTEQLADAHGLPITGQISREGRFFSYFQLFPALSRSASLSQSDAAASMSGSVAERQFDADVHAIARNQLGDGVYGNRAGAAATPYYSGPLGMQITPFTELVWSGHVRVEAEKNVHKPGTRFEWAEAKVNFSLSDGDGVEVGAFESFMTTARKAAGLYADEGDFRFTLANRSAASASAGLLAGMSLFSQATLPVPEPGTPALMLAGLAGLAGVLKRRRGGAPRGRAQASRGAVLGALALGLASAAQADVLASASVTRFGYSLLDLNPGDGIAPRIEFAVRPGVGDAGSHAAASYVLEDNREGLDELRDSSAMLLTMSTAVSSPLISASARMGGSAAGHGYELTAQGSLVNHVTSPIIDLSPGFQAQAEPADNPYGGGTSFRLTPFTQIVWTGDYAMRLEFTKGRSGGNDEFGLVTVSGGIYDTAGNGLDGFNHFTGIVATAPGVNTESGSLRMAFSNDSTEFAVAHLDLRARVMGQLQASPEIRPVPEPATVAMMLCGLAVLGAATRRTRR